VQLNLFKIEKDQFKPLFKGRPVEWCAVASGKTKTNPIVKTFIATNIQKLPPSVRKCPMQGRLDVKNFTISSKVMAILPVSTYRIQAKSFDSVDKEVMSFSALFKIEEK
jgi:hypothetical protein